MKSESEWKTHIVKQGREFGDYARRLEDQFAVGLPDMIWGVKDGPTLMIEAKLVKKNDKFAPTPRQRVELERWSSPDGGRHGLVLGFKNDRFYLRDVILAQEEISIYECDASDPGESFPIFLRRYLR